MLLTPILLHYDDNVQVAPELKSHDTVFTPGDLGDAVIVAVALAGAEKGWHAPFLGSLTEEAPCANSTSALLA